MAVFATLRGLHENASGVGAQVRRLERIGLHCLNEWRRERREHDVPLGQRGAGELKPVSSEDPFLSMQRLMIAPAFNDGLSEQSGPGNALWDWHRKRVGDADRRLESLLVGFAYELLAHDLHEHARRGPPLKHAARLLPDDVERIEALALDLGRNELDVNARSVIARAAPLRYLASVLGNDARRLFVCGRWRRLFATTEHQTEDGERQLGVIFQPSCRAVRV